MAGADNENILRSDVVVKSLQIVELLLLSESKELTERLQNRFCKF